MAAGRGERDGEPDLLARLTELGRRGIARDRFAVLRGLFARSLLRAGPVPARHRRAAGGAPVADLKVPLTVTVTDLDSGELLLYGAGARDAPLVDVLMASCALPLYFPPVRLDGHRCGDGGLRGVLPLDAAAHAGVERVVAVDVGPGFELAAGARRAAAPPVVRAHDQAVGTPTRAAHTLGTARPAGARRRGVLR